MLMMYRYGSRIGFLGVLAPFESVKGRTIVVLLIMFELY